MKLSVVIITKNEAHNLAACLASVSFANEWIVVDSGSTDDTARIAKRLGAQVVVTTDWPGFGKQKNRALGLATGDWVLSLDADERVSPELAAEIKRLVSMPDGADGAVAIASMPRRTSFCGQWIDHCGWSPDRVIRLLRRGSAKFNENLVHESLVVENKNSIVMKFMNPLLHYSYPTPNHYWDKLKTYSEAWAVQKQAEGKKASIGRAMGASCVAFVRSYIVRLGFLDGALGFVVCQMQAQATFYKYFQLYFLNQSKK